MSVSGISDRLREAVWRIEPDNSDDLLGTGFFVAPGVALTCAHVVGSLERVRLTQHGRTDLLSSRIIRPIDPTKLDLAIVVVADGPAPVLACCGFRSASDSFLTRGFSGAAPDGSELRLDARGAMRAAYENYDIGDALELAGDMASKGYSGSPLVDSSTAAIVGLISGGHPARERSWAVPLLGASESFPALAEAIAWNNDNLPAYGTMLNAVGFDNLWRAAARSSFDRLLALEKFDARYDVPRNSIFAQIADFMESPHPVMGIVGDPGIGKSWLLAQVSHSRSAPSILAAELSGDGLSLLGDLIAQRVEAASLSVAPFAEVPTVKAVNQLLQARKQPALILIDGLNEASHLPGFITTWIGNAIAWCRQHGVKLICSSRTEIWPSIVNATDDPDKVFFVGTADLKADGETGETSHVTDPRNLPYGFAMPPLSKTEEDTALATYGLPAHVKPMLQHDPMLYRIAARIGLSKPDATVGRFKLFDSYVDRSLTELLPRLQLGSTRSLRMILATMAGKMDASDGAPIAWSAAREIAGSDAVLDGLVDCGLLVAFGDRIRCRFDGVAEALVPASLEPSSMFDPPGLADVRGRRRHANCLLRLEADGSESEFAIAASRLVAALRNLSNLDPEKDWDSFQLWWTAIAIAEALPASRSDLIDAIYSSFCEFPKFFAVGALRLVLMLKFEQSRLPLLRRAELLLQIAPWDQSWSIRTGDWLERRNGPTKGKRTFVNTSYHVAGVFYRTLREDPTQIEPLLLNALDDERLMDQLRPRTGEERVTVGRMAIDILSLQIDGNAERYLAQGLNMGTQGGIALMRSVVKAQPGAALAYLTPLLLPRPPFEEILTLVWQCVRLLGVARSASVRDVVRRIAPSNDAIGLRVVNILRLFDPDDAGAWERMLTLFRNRVDGASLDRHPKGRFAEALAVAEDWPEKALSWLERNDDISHEDAIFNTVVRWSETGKIASDDFASFVRFRILRMDHEPDKFFDGWLAQVSKLIANPDSKLRPDLIRDVARTPFEELSPIRRHLDNLLLATGLSPTEAEFYASLMLEATRWESESWVRRFATMRTAMPFRIDASALFELSESEADMTAMMAFWTGLRDDEQSIVSTESMRLAADGKMLTKIFTFERCMAYLKSQAAAAGREP